MADDKKAQYAKPASQLDLEARLENGNKSDRVLSTSDAYEAPESGEGERTYAVEDNDLNGYVGTASEYATYSNDTEAPVEADDSAEKQVFQEFVEAAGPVALTYEGSQDQATDEAKEESSESSTKTAAKKTASTNQSGSTS